MVRLKDWGSFPEHPWRGNFNSTMVRLKVHNKTIYYRILSVFQFHYGTIKSSARLVRNDFGRRFQFHYGTIKSVCLLYFTRYRRWFQFHYGTIKSSVPVWSSSKSSYFNSTMVRLKDNKTIYYRILSVFQFHYGTIKSEQTVLHGYVLRISIPLWYD